MAEGPIRAAAQARPLDWATHCSGNGHPPPKGRRRRTETTRRTSRPSAERRRRTVRVSTIADVPKEHRVPISKTMGRRYNDLGTMPWAEAPQRAAAAASAQTWVARPNDLGTTDDPCRKGRFARRPTRDRSTGRPIAPGMGTRRPKGGGDEPRRHVGLPHRRLRRRRRTETTRRTSTPTPPAAAATNRDDTSDFRTSAFGGGDHGVDTSDLMATRRLAPTPGYTRAHDDLLPDHRR